MLSTSTETDLQALDTFFLINPDESKSYYISDALKAIDTHIRSCYLVSNRIQERDNTVNRNDLRVLLPYAPPVIERSDSDKQKQKAWDTYTESTPSLDSHIQNCYLVSNRIRERENTIYRNYGRDTLPHALPEITSSDSDTRKKNAWETYMFIAESSSSYYVVNSVLTKAVKSIKADDSPEQKEMCTHLVDLVSKKRALGDYEHMDSSSTYMLEQLQLQVAPVPNPEHTTSSTLMMA